MCGQELLVNSIHKLPEQAGVTAASSAKHRMENLLGVPTVERALKCGHVISVSVRSGSREGQKGENSSFPDIMSAVKQNSFLRKQPARLLILPVFFSSKKLLNTYFVPNCKH